MGVVIFLGLIFIGLGFLGTCLYVFTKYFDQEQFVFSIMLFTVGSFLVILGCILSKVDKKHHIIIITSNGVVEEYEDCNYETSSYDRVTVITSEGKTIYYYNPSKIEEIK